MRPVRLEDNLGDLAVLGPETGDLFGPLGATSMQEDHIGMASMDTIQRFEDAVIVFALNAAGEGDTCTLGEIEKRRGREKVHKDHGVRPEPVPG